LTEGAWLEVKLLDHALSNAIDFTIAFASRKDASVLGSDARVQLSSTLEELRHVHRLVNGALMDDRSFVNGVNQRNSGVDAMTLVDLLLNDWLRHMVNVVVSDGVDRFSEIDDGALLG